MSLSHALRSLSLSLLTRLSLFFLKRATLRRGSQLKWVQPSMRVVRHGRVSPGVQTPSALGPGVAQIVRGGAQE